VHNRLSLRTLVLMSILSLGTAYSQPSNQAQEWSIDVLHWATDFTAFVMNVQQETRFSDDRITFTSLSPALVSSALSLQDRSLDLSEAGMVYLREAGAAYERNPTSQNYALYHWVRASLRQFGAADQIVNLLLRGTATDTYRLAVETFEVWGMLREIAWILR